MNFEEFKNNEGGYDCLICGRTYASEKEANKCEESCSSIIDVRDKNQVTGYIIKKKKIRARKRIFSESILRIQLCLEGNVSDIVKIAEFLDKFNKNNKQIIPFFTPETDFDIYRVISAGISKDLNLQKELKEEEQFFFDSLCPKLRKPEEIVEESYSHLENEAKNNLLVHYYSEKNQRERMRFGQNVVSIVSKGKLKFFKLLFNIKCPLNEGYYTLSQMENYKQAMEKSLGGKDFLKMNYLGVLNREGKENKKINSPKLELLKKEMPHPKIDFTYLLGEDSDEIFEKFRKGTRYLWNFLGEVDHT